MGSDINQVTLGGTVSGVYEKEIGDTALTTVNLTFMGPGKDGPKEHFIDLDFWGDGAAEAANLVEGVEIIVAGTLVRQAWKKDDEWQSKHSIRATQILTNGDFSEGTADDPPPF